MSFNYLPLKDRVKVLLDLFVKIKPLVQAHSSMSMGLELPSKRKKDKPESHYYLHRTRPKGHEIQKPIGYALYVLS